MSHNIILGNFVFQAHFPLKFIKRHRATLIEYHAIQQGKLQVYVPQKLHNAVILLKYTHFKNAFVCK